MNIIFLSIAFPFVDDRNIYSDLMNEFVDRGENVWVLCQSERMKGGSTQFAVEGRLNILRVRTGNLTGKVSLIEKGLTTLSVEPLFIRAIKKHLSDIKFDLIIYSTPPITFCKVVEFIKKRDSAASYLLLKDIFPQNAVDIGILKENGILHRFFRTREKKLYSISDYIGCMSEGNMKYVLNNNTYVKPEKVELCPNSIKPMPVPKINKQASEIIRSQYHIPNESTLFVYGGNIGIPQGIEFLITVFKAINDRRDVFILVVGDGNKYSVLDNYLKENPQENVKLCRRLAKIDYDRLLTACDVGLIFLSRKFTIPNFPSRLIAYMEMALPVLAATDINTDFKDAIIESGCGFWSESGDIKTFMSYFDKLVSNPVMGKAMGIKGRSWLEEYYTVSRGYDIIMSHFKRGDK